MHVAVIDIGSPKVNPKTKQNNIGWAIVGDETSCGCDLDKCIKALTRLLKAGPLALGFEAPMFVPMRNKPVCLTSVRCGEGNRAFSASIGATALVASTVVVPYVLRNLKQAVPDGTTTLNWHDWSRNLTEPRKMLLFEAFVTNQNKQTDARHIEDAQLAAKELYTKLQNKEEIESSVTVDECFSILGAMLLRTGWTTDASVLSQSCLVVRPGTEQ